MKKKSSHILLIFFNLFFVNFCIAQIKSCCKNNWRIYKTYDDYKNNNPIPDISIISDSYMGNKGDYSMMKFVVKIGLEKKMMDMHEYSYFGYSDGDTILHRFYDKKKFYVLTSETVCLYVQQDNGFIGVGYDKSGKTYVLGSSSFDTYYSNGLNGVLEPIKFDDAINLLRDEPELINNLNTELSNFKKDKYVNSLNKFKILLLAKYFQIYNNKKEGFSSTSNSIAASDSIVASDGIATSDSINEQGQVIGKNFMFFKTWGDYKNNNPIEGWTFNKRCNGLFGEKCKLEINGDIKRISYNNIHCFGYVDGNGIPHRFYKNQNYYVLAGGEIGYYLNVKELNIYHADTTNHPERVNGYSAVIPLKLNTVTTPVDLFTPEVGHHVATVNDYFSITMDGPIKKYWPNEAYSLLNTDPEIQKQLADSYNKNNDPSGGNSFENVKIKIVNRINIYAKYFQMYNDKKHL